MKCKKCGKPVKTTESIRIYSRKTSSGKTIYDHYHQNCYAPQRYKTNIAEYFKRVDSSQ